MPYHHVCHHCGKHLSRKQTLDMHIARYHGGEDSSECQTGGFLAKIAPEKCWSSGVLGEASLTDSTAYLKQLQNNPEGSQQTPQQPLADPLGRSLISLDQTMQGILQNHTIGDDYAKAQLYSQALQRYLQRTDQYREKPLGKVTLEALEPVQETKPGQGVSQIKDILRQTLPTTLIRGGTALADTMDNLPGVRWDDKLQLIVGGKTVPNSNIVDLLTDLARNKRTSKPPKGMDELLEVLKDHNIPQSLITNEARRSALTSTRSSRVDMAPHKKTKTTPLWTENQY